jgi:chromosome segregation ATPase
MSFGGESNRAGPPAPEARSQLSGGPDAACGEHSEITGAINALAHSLARTIVTALQEIARQSATERLELERGLQQQLDGLVQDLATTRQEVELLRQADRAHAEMDQDLRREIQDLAALVSDRLDALFGRLDLHNGELSGLKSALSDNSSSVASVVERLNRQAEAIRRFAQTQESEWATLERLGEVLSSLQAMAAQRTPASVDDL